MVLGMWMKWLLAGVLLGISGLTAAAESEAGAKDRAVERLIQRYTEEGRKPEEIVTLAMARFPGRADEVVQHVAQRWPAEFDGIFSAALAAGASGEDVVEGAVRGGVPLERVETVAVGHGLSRSRVMVGVVKGGADVIQAAKNAVAAGASPTAVVRAAVEAGLGREAVARAAMAAGLDVTDVVAGLVEAGVDVAEAAREVIQLDPQRAQDIVTTAVTIAPGAATNVADSALAGGMSEDDVRSALAVGVLLSDPETDLVKVEDRTEDKGPTDDRTPRYRPVEPALAPASSKAGPPASES